MQVSTMTPATNNIECFKHTYDVLIQMHAGMWPEYEYELREVRVAIVAYVLQVK
jgi:hypothetical protein